MDIPSETSSDESFKVSNKKSEHICPYEGCTASFSKNSKLTYHIRRHTGERPFICDEPGCEKTYLYSFHLRRHKEVHHGTHHVERITCTHEGCYLELANKYSLKKHIRIKHNSDRQYPFSCDECRQGFHRKRQLLQHSYVHTGVLPFICEICETRFATVRDRNRHKRTHTSYTCTCSKSFERWSSLLAHKKICVTARPQCNICNKTFKQNMSLKYHLDSHLCKNVEVFSCGYENCGRSYKYKKNLIYHINKCHKKIVKPQIPCTHQGCQKTFSKMQNLKLHVARYHSDDNIKKRKKLRETRKDKGKSRTYAAALLAGLPLPTNSHRALLNRKSVKLPEAITSSNSISNSNANVDNIEENSISTEQGEVNKLKAQLTEVLLKNCDESTTGHGCARNDNENGGRCVKALC